MGIPSYDTQGYPEPYDDGDIFNEHSVLRYVDTVRYFDAEKKKFASEAFSTSSASHAGANPGMSTDWKQSVEALGGDTISRAKGGEVVAELNAGFLRGLGTDVKIGQTPIVGTANDNPHHTDVWGVKSQSKRRKMRDEAIYHDASRSDSGT